VTGLLIVVALGFAWSMGAHYTGACMGMPHALRAVSSLQALLLMAPLTLLGATFASHAVEHTVAHRLTVHPLGLDAQVIVIGVAFGLTTLYNRLRAPTSTIQILVFSLAGTALGAGVGVRWHTIGLLAIIWVAAPLVAAGLGYALTLAFDQIPALRRAGTAVGNQGVAAREHAGGWLGAGLVAVGLAASFTMGSNDVANATGSLVATHTFSTLAAGAVGGGGLALGVLTWGRPLLKRIAFDVVDLDRPMATAAQAVQAVVVLLAVGFGFFTSMNQALIGAMAGAGGARGRRVVHRASFVGILRGWALGPAGGIALGYLISRVVVAGGVRLH
jgi:PiT family inorganic phosphate transporter